MPAVVGSSRAELALLLLTGVALFVDIELGLAYLLSLARQFVG